MLGNWFDKLKEPKCIHRYKLIKSHDNEDFKTGKMGIVSYYKCEKCGKVKEISIMYDRSFTYVGKLKKKWESEGKWQGPTDMREIKKG
ncbi:hypothetical protein MWG54_12655 [Bacillus cereus]|uniref:hypothetical protein n=1 Tax=Bacillus cereus TaxID=1396 RepID=UPI001FF6BFDD|nr:hypothetical protein [Bacillus cereus]UOX98672.1 hypothetical protein MWG54_12655 [Bacillus cereus]